MVTPLAMAMEMDNDKTSVLHVPSIGPVIQSPDLDSFQKSSRQTQQMPQHHKTIQCFGQPVVPFLRPSFTASGANKPGRSPLRGQLPARGTSTGL